MEIRYFKKKNFIIFYLSGLLSGFVSGLLGLGSVNFHYLFKGLVMVPTMLHFGIHPRVASAVSSFNYIWMSLNNLITLLIVKSLPLITILWFSLH